MNYNFKDNKYSIDELEQIISNNELSKDDWDIISCYQKLTEDFIEKYIDNMYWDGISMLQKISEEFIEKYIDKVNWIGIQWEQKLSESFIERFKDKISWYVIIRSQNLSFEFLEKHLYCYSLYINDIDRFTNKYVIIKLQEKYKEKYEIDKLNYELRLQEI